MNILFTSSGRRGYLLQYFREALGESGLIHASNNQPLVSSFAYADFCVQSPDIYSDAYIPFLLEYCEKNDIQAIIPLFDIGLPILSENRHLFSNQGVNVIVSDHSFVKVCNDKWETGAFLEKHGLMAPKLYLSLEECLKDLKANQLDFPLFIKPRWGMGSIGVHKAETEAELIFYFNYARKEVLQSYLKYESTQAIDNCVIIQEQLPGVEFGLDIINDLEGKHLAVFVKKKLAMRSGETDAAITIDEPTLKELGQKLGTLSNHRGVLDIDVFYDGQNAIILDMNARFGGGYPFSHIAGADIPRAILHWLSGKEAPAECFDLKMDVCGVKDVLPIIMEINN